MTTENGVTPPKVVRSAINTFLDRRDWLTSRQDARVAEGRGRDGFADKELAAIAVALPLLEAEWDAVTRHWQAERRRETVQ